MKIVWLTNFAPPQIADKCDWLETTIHGWNTKLIDYLLEKQELELVLFFPQAFRKSTIKGDAYGDGKLKFVGFYEKPIPETDYNASLERVFRQELNVIKPDIVHIWGTEYVHTLAMVNAFDRPDRTIISLQGLISVLGEHYTDYLPEKVINHWTLRDFLRKDNIKYQKEKFIKRGIHEISALKKVGHVAGRTKWDHDTVLSINPNIEYHYCEEFLRQSFFSSPKWDYSTCEKRTIFMSQADYPIKGMHIALEVLQKVKKAYPDVKLYLAGNSMIPANLKDRIKQTSYSWYIEKLIKEYNLENHVFYLGTLSEMQMIERYLRTNVYLQASILENSPNSLKEALFLGVPSVASNVGGTMTIMSDNQKGVLYELMALDVAVQGIQRAFDGEYKPQPSIAMSETNIDRSSVEDGYKEYMTMYWNVVNKS